MKMNSKISKKEVQLRAPSISRECFADMQSKSSIALTAPYHVEEFIRLVEIFNTFTKADMPEHFIAIGSGNLRYMELALKNCETYNAIEMNLDDHITPKIQRYLKLSNNLNLINKSFSDVAKKELPEGRKFFLFLFNVFPYIPDALKTMKELTSSGDIVMISSWNNKNFAARRLREIYYEHLQSNDASNAFVPPVYAEKDYLDGLEKKASEFSTEQRRVNSKITDTLILKI